MTHPGSPPSPNNEHPSDAHETGPAARAQVVALADVDEIALAKAAAEFGIGRAVPDYRELLDDPDIDVVDVVTGNRPHFQISWDALQAAKELIDDGFVGEPYIFNGYEQNSQWIDPHTPLRHLPDHKDRAQGRRWGNLGQGALVQQTINAFEASYRSRAWVDFPLDDSRATAAG